MQSFLSRVAEHIHQNYAEKTDKLCIVLPNKRGALFLKNNLARIFNKNIWLPVFISAEELMEKISGLQQLEDVELLCRLYDSYLSEVKESPEPFDSFAKWGNIILQDFNEIDRYLANAPSLYSNLKNIKEIENWSLAEEELSDFQKNYIRFMGSLGNIYTHFTSRLLQDGYAYQGLAYKMAVKSSGNHPFINNFEKIIFCGFNALNKAETKIFGDLCGSLKAEMLWDADRYYTENESHEAGLFLRKNRKLFGSGNQLQLTDHFKENKNIEIVAVPGPMGQAMSVREAIQFFLRSGKNPDSIAIVLANEKLLWPVLKLLPEEVECVNITMEYPLKYTAPYNFIELLLKIQQGFEKQSRKTKYIYYKEFLEIIRHTFFKEYASILGITNTGEIISRIIEKNYSFIEAGHLKEFFGDNNQGIMQLFSPWQNAKTAAEAISNLLNTTKQFYVSSEVKSFQLLELEYIEVLIRNFNRVKGFVEGFEYLNTVRSLKMLFSQIVGGSSVAFLGEPLKGIQIMGVLETRTLDFENVIMVSVNEGVLPSGKSINSFIPNDLKRHFDLPLYQDKDAIYAYHFYRLLQRAKNVFMIYDTESDTFGKGEKSRFVSQLEFELPAYNANVNPVHKIARLSADQKPEGIVISIPKTNETLKQILNKALSSEEFKGLSPSSMITYKNCGLRFYLRYGAGLKETEEVEESAEAGTFGTILHESLENLYKSFVGKTIFSVDYNDMKLNSDKAVENSFMNYFSKAEAFMGKNLLQQDVLKIYVKKLLESEMSYSKKTKPEGIKLIALEKELCASIEVEIDGKKETVFIKGKADRIDECDGLLRIIDYKTSLNSKDKFAFLDFEQIISEDGYDKMYQLFFYAWLAWKNKLAAAEKIMPCIIPFKEFQENSKYILKDKNKMIFDDEILKEFEAVLSKTIGEIFNRQIEFKQTEKDDHCKYCPYIPLCLR